MSVVSSIVFLFAALAAAQAPPREAALGPPGADAALVGELRALRESVERFLTANVRVQLLMGRLQLQEARIQTIARQATELDGQMAQLSRERDELAQQRNAAERMAKQSPEADVREDFGQQAVALAERLKRVEVRLAVVSTDLASVQQALATEQNRWGDFNARLEELELELRRR